MHVAALVYRTWMKSAHEWVQERLCSRSWGFRTLWISLFQSLFPLAFSHSGNRFEVPWLLMRDDHLHDLSLDFLLSPTETVHIDIGKDAWREFWGPAFLGCLNLIFLAEVLKSAVFSTSAAPWASQQVYNVKKPLIIFIWFLGHT